MTTIIRTSTTSTTGYELVIRDEQGNETVHLLNDRPKNEPCTLILPENPSNRKYFNSTKVDKAGGEIELTYKESIKLGQRTEPVTKKPLEDYLDEADRALYLALVEKAKAIRAEANKKVPLTKEEKLQRQIERLQAQLANMNKEEA